MVISSLSIIANIFVLIFHHRNVKIQTNLPYWVRIYICNYLARILRMKNPRKTRSINKIPNKSQHLKNYALPNSMSLLVNALNLNDNFGVPKIKNYNTDYDYDNLNKYTKKYDQSKSYSDIANELDLILKQLIFITDKIRNDENNEGKSLDWKFAAMVIDRLCILIFSFATILSTTLILITSKNFFSDSDTNSKY
jgi:nicotinic acetylcholine receptor